jgi:predicted transposase YbfD/YdcC
VIHSFYRYAALEHLDHAPYDPIMHLTASRGRREKALSASRSVL